MILETMVVLAVIGTVVGPAIAKGFGLGKTIQALTEIGKTVEVEVDGQKYVVDLSDFVGEDGEIRIHHSLVRLSGGEVLVLTKAEVEFITFAEAIKKASEKRLNKDQLRAQLEILVRSAAERMEEIKRTPSRSGRKV